MIKKMTAANAEQISAKRYAYILTRSMTAAENNIMQAI